MSEYLNREAMAALLEGRNEIRVDMPDEIRQIVDNIVNRLMAELGESPEAWRGALEATHELLNRPLMTYIADQSDMKDGPRSFITMIMVVLGQFLSNPISLANLKRIHDNKERES